MEVLIKFGVENAEDSNNFKFNTEQYERLKDAEKITITKAEI